MAVSGIVYGGRGLDRHSGLLQCGGSNDVPLVDAGTSALHVPAGAAGRDGTGQCALGMGWPPVKAFQCACMVGFGDGCGIDHHSTASVDRRRTEYGSRRCAGLMTGPV